MSKSSGTVPPSRSRAPFSQSVVARPRHLTVAAAAALLVAALVPAGAHADSGPPRDITAAHASHEACLGVVDGLVSDTVLWSTLFDQATAEVRALDEQARTAEARVEKLRARVDRKAAKIAELRKRLRAR